MIKNKKIFLGALSFATLVAPIASVIACGSCDNDDDDGGDYVDKTGFNRLFDQTRQAINERLEFVAKTDSTTLDISNPAFVYNFDKEWKAEDLGLVFPENASPVPPITVFAEGYYIEEVDLVAKTVKVRLLAVDITNSNYVANVTFFTLTNFGVKYDLANISEISPRAADINITQNITNPALATVAQIETTLNALAVEYLTAQVANVVATTDYTISAWTKTDGSAIIDENLQTKAVSYKATISAAATPESKLKNQTTLTINLPQLNVYDIKSFSDFTSPSGDWKVSDPTKVPTSYVMEVVNQEVINEIQQTNPNVTWEDDLFAFYSLSDAVSSLPQTLDLTKPQTIKLTLMALPYSDNALGKNTVTVTLPILTPTEDQKKLAIFS